MSSEAIRQTLNYYLDKLAESNESIVGRFFDNVRFRYKCFRLRNEINFSDYEMPEFRIMEHYLKQRPGAVIDAGANYGVFSVFFSRHSSQVLAFEPVPLSSRLLNHLLQKYSAENVTTYCEALSDNVYRKELSIPVVNGTRNYFLASLEESGSSENHVVREVVCNTIDNRARQLSGVSFIKIDVEGHESAVLRGAAKTLAQYKPGLMIEFNSPPKASNPESYSIYKNLSEMGYLCFYADDEHTFRLWDESADPPHVNYFFFTPEDAKIIACLTDKITLNEA